MKTSLGAKTLLYPTPVMVVGTYGADGRPNVMTAAWGGICCSQPPCLAVSLRKATLTYQNLMLMNDFTVSLPSEAQVKAADFFGVATGKRIDKFQASGLTAVASDRVNAPYVGEFPLVLECRVVHTFELGLHTQFVGEIVDVKADQSVLTDGAVDVERLHPILFAPDPGVYYGIGPALGHAFAARATGMSEGA